jgi:hypothetical protein
VSRVIIIVIAISALFAIIAGLSVSWAIVSSPPRDLFSEKEHDKILLDKASDLAEVKAFRDRYGEPEVNISGVQAFFTKTKAEITGVPYNDTGAMEPRPSHNRFHFCC